MDEVKAYFKEHKNLWQSGNVHNFNMWTQARNAFLSETNRKVGPVTCGGCRAKIYNWLNGIIN